MGVKKVPRLHICQRRSLIVNCLGVSFLSIFQHFHFKSPVYLAFYIFGPVVPVANLRVQT